jgi:hypothetical protein
MVHFIHSFTIKKASALLTDTLQNLLKMIYYLKQGDHHLFPEGVRWSASFGVISLD